MRKYRVSPYKRHPALTPRGRFVLSPPPWGKIWHEIGAVLLVDLLATTWHPKDEAMDWLCLLHDPNPGMPVLRQVVCQGDGVALQRWFFP